MTEEKTYKQNDSRYSKQDLSKADLKGKSLRMADLKGANLTEADLSEADLTEADLREADLQGANLTRANLMGAFLRDANLRGADLSFAINISCIDIESAYIDKETKFPNYIRIKWKSDRDYVCKEIITRDEKGRRKKTEESKIKTGFLETGEKQEIDEMQETGEILKQRKKDPQQKM